MSEKISICFYGITRDLKKTYPSIEENIIKPAKKYGEVKIFCHFFNNKYINNKKSGELNIKNEMNWDLFNYEKLITDSPNNFLKNKFFKNIYKYGDPHLDNFKTIENLMHQLYSLKKAYKISEKFNSNLTLFMRPDLLYLDSFESIIKNNLSIKKDIINLASWQSYRGLNDRFSVCNSSYSAKIYANRIEQINNYLNDVRRPLHGEELLYYSIDRSNAKIFLINHRASRVRANGLIKKESFKTPNHLIIIKRFIINQQNKSKILTLFFRLIVYFYNKLLNLNRLKNFYREYLRSRIIKILKVFKKLIY